MTNPNVKLVPERCNPDHLADLTDRKRWVDEVIPSQLTPETEAEAIKILKEAAEPKQ